ncbi:MAG: Na(+)-translocating NADH-quinone reductase subunit C [Pseudomonadales bacterium]
MSNKDSVKQTLIVALLVCIVCSVVVSSAAVAFKSLQTENKLLDRNKNILAAAGLYKEDEHSEADVPKLFGEFTVKLADLDTNVFLTDQQATDLGFDVSLYDQRKASKDPALSAALARGTDIASIGRRERYSSIYLIENEQGIERIVLPIRGYGLWGTLYGFMALEGDMNTVSGLGYYEHKETPGLGAKVDDPSWKASWIGKEIYAADGSVATEVLKGAVNQDSDTAIHQIDGLSGATLTSRGVHNMMQYWLGPEGYGPLLASLR